MGVEAEAVVGEPVGVSVAAWLDTPARRSINSRMIGIKTDKTKSDAGGLRERVKTRNIAGP